MSRTGQKIMFFTGNMSCGGGTERVLSVIANGLSARGFRVFIVSLRGDGESFFSLQREIKVYWAEKERKKTGIRGNLHYLAAVVDREGPESLVDVDIILGCYSFFLKHRRPELYWISWEHFTFCHPFRKNRLLRKVIRRMVVTYADHLVVLTEKDRKDYERKLRPRCPVTCIYNPAPYEGLRLKQKEKRMIFAAGRLVREKGFDLLLKSFLLLEDKYPQWSLVIAGDGREKKRLKRAAKAMGLKRIYFIGTVVDIEKYYARAAFCALPSRYEGFGMTLVEAMSFMLPTVSYDCPAGPGEIITDGQDGFLVPPGDVERFAQKMELLMKDDRLRRRMGERAKKAVQRFDKERILDEWEKIFVMRQD